MEHPSQGTNVTGDISLLLFGDGDNNGADANGSREAEEEEVAVTDNTANNTAPAAAVPDIFDAILEEQNVTTVPHSENNDGMHDASKVVVC